MIKKGLAVAVILLFIGVAFAPTINSSIVKDDFVEFDVELSGLGKKHTVKLTQQEADEVELLFDNIRTRLDNIETREEFKEILKWAILELEKIGILENVDIEELQSLVFDENHNQNVPGFNDFSFKQQKIGMFDPDENFNCLITGETTETHFFNGIFPNFFLNLLLIISDIFGMDFDELIDVLVNFPIFLILFGVPLALKYILSSLIGSLFPISTDVTMTFGVFGLGEYEQYHYPSEGWVYTNGTNGNINWEGSLKGQLGNHLWGLGWIAFIGATGFSGIKLDGFKKCYYIGKADHVSLDTYWI